MIACVFALVSDFVFVFVCVCACASVPACLHVRACVRVCF